LLDERLRALEVAPLTVPAGAVVAFDLEACPPGWSAHTASRDRVLIGAGSNYNRGAMVGEATHTISADEMPAHAHTIPVYTPTGAIAMNGETDLWVHGGEHVGAAYGSSQPTATAGGGVAFSNLQPSLALLYCRKD
jgi:microcystin-dependent protein